jgi:hypothetical protein
MRPRSKRDWSPVATTIGEGATVGANATIVCGCHIGRHAFIGAGAVVTRPVPAHAVVLGNPGRVHGYVCECCQPLRGRGRNLTCAKCGLTYVKTRAGVRKADAAQPAPGSATRGLKPRAGMKTPAVRASHRRGAQASRAAKPGRK